MKGVNKVILVGNLGDEPEIKNLDNNVKVAKFSLATNETYKEHTGQSHTLDQILAAFVLAPENVKCVFRITPCYHKHIVAAAVFHLIPTTL